MPVFLWHGPPPLAPDQKCRQLSYNAAQQAHSQYHDHAPVAYATMHGNLKFIWSTSKNQNHMTMSMA
jgi:hypothetical protein